MSEYPVEQLSEQLRRAATAADFLATSAEALRYFDGLNDGIIAKSGLSLACRAGCSLCCSLRVDVFAHEVLFLAEHVRAHFSPIEFAELFGRLEAHAATILPLRPFEHATRNVPCAMLRDGKCSVYLARPHSCRRHHSQDLAACQYTFDNPTDLETPAAHDRNLYRTLTEAMVQGVEIYAELGFDYTIYELGTALHEALSDPACWDRWRQHEQVFLRASVTPAE